MLKRSLLALSFTFALAAPSTMLAAGDAAKGKELYTKRCRVCHTDDGSGSAAMKKKNPKMLALGGPEVQKMSDAEFAKAVKEAASHKAIAKSLTDDNLADLVAYIRTLKK